MSLMKKNLILLLIVLMPLIAIGCKGKSSAKDDNTDPAAKNTNPFIDNATLEDTAANTFSSKAIQLLVSSTYDPDQHNPAYYEFASTAQYKTQFITFNVTNKSSDSQVVTLALYDLSGTFRLMDSAGKFYSYLPDVTMNSGETKTYTLTFDATLAGAHTAFIEVTSSNLSGHIKFPFMATVSAPSDFRVISAAYLCSDDSAPDLTKLDFYRVPTGKSATTGVKICNLGGNAMKLNGITFEATNKEMTSGASSTYTSGTDSGVTYPSSKIPADKTSAYSVKAMTSIGTQVDPNGLTIAGGSYMSLNVSFAPDLDQAPPSGSLFKPVPFKAIMQLDTSMGQVDVDTIGMGGGKEPQLALTYKRVTDGLGGMLDPMNPQGAIGFGSVGIFEDYFAEAFSEVEVIVSNVGSKGSELTFSIDDLPASSYFSRSDDGVSLPLKVKAGESKSFYLKYHPDPNSGDVNPVAEVGYDLGEMTYSHNAPFGPTNTIQFIGEQSSANAVRVTQGTSSVKIKQGATVYTKEKPKQLCIAKPDGSASWTLLEFNVENNSLLSSINGTWSVTLDKQSDNVTSSGSITPSGGSIQVSPSVLKSTGVEVSSKKFSFVVAPAVDINSKTKSFLPNITGKLTLTNVYNATYSVLFNMTVSTTGDCSGGAGTPYEKEHAFVVDAITMNMPSGAITEPATNRSPFKAHMIVDLDPQHGYARLHGLTYSPDANVSPVTQFRSYAHQLTGAYFGCRPYPDNPYSLEYTEGSYNGPFSSCSFENSDFKTDPNVACMNTNGAQDYTQPNGEVVKVFYHELVQFADESSCTPKFYGRFAYFYLTGTQGVADAVQNIINTVGYNGSEAQYDQARGAFRFGSYIQFNDTYTCGGTKHLAGELLTDPDGIKACWKQFEADKVSRTSGFVDECNYFNFNIADGCIPSDVPWIAEVPKEQRCTDKSITFKDPDTWTGFGEYQPTDEETRYDLTLRNVHLQAFVLHANGFFENKSKMLFSDIYVTLTSKAIGAGSDIYDLIAPKARSDFSSDKILLSSSSDTAKTYWIEHGKNGKFTVGNFDDVACDPANPKTSCRGNYQYYNSSKIMHAGEPFDFTQTNPRGMLVGTGSFHGKGEMAPFFAQENSLGQGSSLYFTLHMCMQDTDEANTSEDQGCYDWHVDQDNDDGDAIPNLLSTYESHDLLTADDVTKAQSSDPTGSAAYVNYKIYNFERNRATDYWNKSQNYFYDTDSYEAGSCGGYGH